MALTFDVYTVGGLPFISQAFKGIVLILGDASFKNALKVALLWGIVIWTLQAMFKKNMLTSWLLVSFFFFNGFYSARVNVNIIDTKLGQSYLVTDVPFGVAIVSSLFSTLSYTLTNLIDNAFHTGTVIVYGASNAYVSDIDYQKVGYLGAFDYFLSTKEITTDEIVETSRIWKAYNEQCLIPYIATMDESQLTDFVKEKDLFYTGKLKVPLKLIMSYDGVKWYCDEFYDSVLKPKIENFISTVVSSPNLIGFSDYTELSNKFLASVNALTSASYSVQSLIAQSATLNALKKAVVSYASDSEEFNREILASYLAGEEKAKTNFSAKALGELAKDLVPEFANVMNFLIIIASSTIAFLFLLPVSGSSVEAFRRYVELSAWVSFFNPAFAVVDAITKVAAIYKLQSTFSLAGTNGLTINSVGKALTTIEDSVAIAGIIGFFSIPGIAWLLLKGSEYVVASLGQSVMSRFSGGVTAEEGIKASTAEKVGYDLTGKIGEGFKIRSSLFANPTSMSLSYGTAVAGFSESVVAGSYMQGISSASMEAGAGTATYRSHDGSIEGMMQTGALTKGIKAYATPYGVITQKPTLDGGVATQSFQKRFDGNLFQSQLSDNYRKAISQRLSQTYQELSSLTTENSVSTQAGYREFTKFEEAVLDQYRDGKTYSGILESSEIESLKEMKQIRDDLQNALGVDKQTATRITNDLAAKLQFDANFRKAFTEAAKKGNIRKLLNLIDPSLGDTVKVTKEKAGILTKATKEISDFAESKGYEKALSAIHKLSMNDSIAHSLASSYQEQEGKSIDLSETRSYSEKVASSLHKLQSYEEQEQLLAEKGSSFSIDLSQRFIEWYARKTGLSLEAAHENLNKMAVLYPLNFETLATEFSEDYTKKYRIDNKGLTEKITERFKNHQNINPKDFYSRKKKEIENKAIESGVADNLHSNLQREFDSMERQFEGSYRVTSGRIHSGKGNITPNNLRDFSEMKQKVWNLSPEEAKHLLTTNRAELLWENTGTLEKIAWGSSSVASGLSLLDKEGVEKLGEMAKEAGKNVLNFVKTPVGLVTTALLAEGAIIAYDNYSYAKTELQKIAKAEREGRIKQINSLDELDIGEVGIIQKGGYTFEIIKEMHDGNLTPEEAMASSRGVDVSTYTIVAKGQQNKPQVFILNRDDADRLINEGRTPGWLEIGSLHIGSDNLPNYRKDN